LDVGLFGYNEVFRSHGNKRMPHERCHGNERIRCLDIRGDDLKRVQGEQQHLQKSKKTFSSQKRPFQIKRDVCKSKETCLSEKKLI